MDNNIISQTLLKTIRRNLAIDSCLFLVSFIVSIGILGICIALFITLAKGSFLSFEKFGFSFLLRSEWNPVTENFGGLTAIFGTLTTSFLALLMGVPIAFGISYFLTELAPNWLKSPLIILIELLAIVPSIILGMWGLFIFAPTLGLNISYWLNNTLSPTYFIGHLFSGPHIGINILTAGFVLSLMIIPFMASIFKDAFTLVPRTLKEAAYGLGATTWEVVWDVVLPYTRRQVIGGIMLGLGRALGETMAVAFVIGNSHLLSYSLLMPGSTISSVLANEFTEAFGDLYSSSLMYLSLILLLLSATILCISQWLFNKTPKKRL